MEEGRKPAASRSSLAAATWDTMEQGKVDTMEQGEVNTISIKESDKLQLHQSRIHHQVTFLASPSTPTLRPSLRVRMRRPPGGHGNYRGEHFTGYPAAYHW